MFSSKGNFPLAKKLSGGDYDGDIAWICFKPSIVNELINVDIPSVEILSSLSPFRKTGLAILTLLWRMQIQSRYSFSTVSISFYRKTSSASVPTTRSRFATQTTMLATLKLFS